MLNVPPAIQALYEDDGVRKNFRAHFPNGEFPDITNENVVQESLKFTESVCSQNTFKYGPAEASVIEFEMVGVGNVYGMMIECGIEIDTTKLSAAVIAAIQSGLAQGVYVGTLVLAADSDIGYGYYRIPLGVFRVDACPRNHENMAHRRVTAYSGLTTPTPPIFQRTIDALPHAMRFGSTSNGKYYFDLLAYMAANIGAPYIDQHYTRSVLYTASSMSSSTRSVSGTAVNNYYLRLTVEEYTTPTTSSGISKIYGYSCPIDYAAINDFAVDAAETYGIEAPKAYGVRLSTSNIPSSQVTAFVGNIKEGEIYSFYPWGGLTRSAPYTVTFAFPHTITMELIHLEGGVWVTVDSVTATATAAPVLYEFTENTARTPIILYASATGPSGFGWSFADAIDYAKLMDGYLEIVGLFARASRTGGFDVVDLDPDRRITVGPIYYSEAWWDEYNVDPIGTVKVTYRDKTGQEVTEDITIGAGASVYDMTNNSALKMLSSYSSQDVQTLLSASFASEAAKAAFTPVELTMRGFPWFEAGDAIRIRAEDGTIVSSYILRKEMSGIQHLVSTITAEGGEIIEGA